MAMFKVDEIDILKYPEYLKTDEQKAAFKALATTYCGDYFGSTEKNKRASYTDEDGYLFSLANTLKDKEVPAKCESHPDNINYFKHLQTIGFDHGAEKLNGTPITRYPNDSGEYVLQDCNCELQVSGRMCEHLCDVEGSGEVFTKHLSGCYAVEFMQVWDGQYVLNLYFRNMERTITKPN